MNLVTVTLNNNINNFIKWNNIMHEIKSIHAPFCFCFLTTPGNEINQCELAAKHFPYVYLFVIPISLLFFPSQHRVFSYLSQNTFANSVEYPKKAEDWYSSAAFYLRNSISLLESAQTTRYRPTTTYPVSNEWNIFLRLIYEWFSMEYEIFLMRHPWFSTYS